MTLHVLQTLDALELAIDALKAAGFALHTASQHDFDKARGIIRTALVRLGEAQPDGDESGGTGEYVD